MGDDGTFVGREQVGSGKLVHAIYQNNGTLPSHKHLLNSQKASKEKGVVCIVGKNFAVKIFAV